MHYLGSEVAAAEDKCRARGRIRPAQMRRVRGVMARSRNNDVVRMIPTELHIRLIVYDATAAAGLRAAALHVLKAGECSATLEVEEYFYRVYRCILAVEAAYESFQSFSLDSDGAAVQMLPNLCADWRDMVHGMKWSECAEDMFGKLSLLSAGAVIGDVVGAFDAQKSERSACALHFVVDRDANGEWTAAAAQPQGRAESVLQWSCRRLRHLMDQPMRRGAKAAPVG